MDNRTVAQARADGAAAVRADFARHVADAERLGLGPAAGAASWQQEQTRAGWDALAAKFWASWPRRFEAR